MVTFTFSEAVTGFSNADLTIPNGTLSAVASGDGGVTWTATLTPTSSVTDANNMISIDRTGVADASSNPGVGTTNSNNYAVSTVRPTASIVVSDNSLIVGETSLVTITFSEAVTGFTNADLTIANGTLTGVTSGDGGITYTATFTPTASLFDATNLITLANTGVTKAAGNTGSGTTDSNNYAIDTSRPGAPTTTIDLATAGDTGLSNSDNITKSIAPTVRASLTGTNAVSGDTLNLLLGGASLGTPKTKVLGGAGISDGYADFTIADGDLGSDGDKTLTANVTDAAGNIGTAGGSLTITLDTTTPAVTLTGGSLSYTDKTAAAAIDSSATVTESGTPGLSLLTVQITASNDAADTLSLPAGASSGINLSGTHLRSETTNIGTVTVSSVNNSRTWTLTFLSSAAATDIQDVVRAIQYNNSSNNPGASNRTVTFNLTDGAGNAATAATRDIAVTAINDAPTNIALSAGSVSTFDSNGATIGNLSATDLDNSSWTFTIISVTHPSNADVTAGNLFSITGTTLSADTPSALPAGSYTVRVQADDGGAGGTYQKDMTITVSNILVVTTNVDTGADATTGSTYTAEMADGSGLSLHEALSFAASGATIQFAAGLSGQTITLGSDVTVADGVILNADSIGAPGSLTITGNTLNLNGTLTINNSSGDTLTIASTSAGRGTLSKTGAGKVTLSSTGNSAGFSGGITLSGGTLGVSAATHLSTGTLTLDGGTLDNGNATFTINNGLVLGSSGGTINVSSANKTLTLTNNISGTGALIKSNGGTLVLSGNNSYSGGTTIRGTNGVSITGSSTGAMNLGTGAVTVASGSALTITGTGTTVSNNIIFNDDSDPYTAITVTNANAVTLSGVLSGAEALTKAGAGTLTLTADNTHGGAVIASAGGLTLLGGSSIGDSSAVTVNSGATLTLAGGGETIGSLSGAGNIVLTLYRLTAGGDNTSTTFSGVISGSGSGISKTGTGMLTLTGANTYTGATTVSAGGLTLSGGSAIADSSAVTVASGATVVLSANETIGSLSGAGSVALGANTLSAGGNNTSTSFSGAIGGTGGLTKTDTGTLTLSGANTYTGATTVLAGGLTLNGGSAIADASALSVTGTLTLGATETIGALSGGGMVTLGSNPLTVGQTTNTSFSGVIGGTGGLIKTGSGALTLTGDNAYTGSTTVSAGTLIANPLADTTAVSVASGANFTAWVAETIGSISGTGTVLLNSELLTVGGNSASTEVSGVISGSGSLAKAGSGTLTLSGTSTYSGTTTVSAGTLLLTGTIASATTVASSATLRGTGTVDGALIIASGATLAPGVTGTNNGIGTLTVNGNFILNGALMAELASLFSYDQVIVYNSVTLNSSTSSVNVGRVNG
ncbi:MAG: Ig-like domain-containing protein [Methylobacter sp.]|nr:Ig-like domain-containing protein [Methylobacter sp.]